MSGPNIQPVYQGHLSPVSHDFLFRGLFTCGDCHRQLIGERQKGHIYYRCHGRHRPATCVREEALANEIETALSWMDAGAAAQRLRMAGPRRFRPAGEQRDALEANLARLARHLERLTDLYLDGQLEHEGYRARRASLAAQKTELERKLLSFSEPPPVESDLDLVRLYQTASDQERRELILCLTDRREVVGKQVCITFL